ncbi:electron transport complex subunit RsxB [Pseudomonas capsici]|uniref:Electron transport complex subunit RsxB n=1 Tax=Pseudomonas capsici TaxID=2810614 RepID=A0ABT3BZA3_9PSED|nr:electron transport complex subunit RsxB [Pseudomonas capsici]MCV4265138.1 electron transport complex subunit RsxB [Pseudomonas capsici]MCV4269572.1 electron transport complex subunit RsxB [Pseudomonas capsici]MCV4279515.1 electron transport complex subunit RsxB [Pseudomonas capsici]MCV4333397.1 electron transport complex subunit RsxB [Pseudomonas capsici]MCV4378179.1 electron transport complex subunit RsxB [Pseudomonas capsici]
MNLIQRIDALLPQTQCGKCGHPGCKPYAEGIASGEAINKCPPGGEETIAQLAQLLRIPVLPLDTERGSAPAQVAFIREAECIGCTKCIQACPVDAIVGAAKQMHTVIIDECTGCDLCVAPCPVDCIEMHPLPLASVTPIVGGLASGTEQLQARAQKRNHARHRFESRNARLHREQEQRLAERQARAQRPLPASTSVIERSRADKSVAEDEALKKARITLAMSRAQLNKSLKAFGHPPIAEQAARLVELQREFEDAEQALEKLLAAAAAQPRQPVAKVDNSGVKRAKIQLAMARSALKKAETAEAPAEQLAALTAELQNAEMALSAAEAALADANA